jgi:serine O-acetyltransferase
VPTIGKNSIISAGSKILGPIRIGQNCVIGANAVVTSDVPDFCLAVGVPARVIKTDISIEDYR